MKVKFTELNTGYKGEKKVSRLSPKGRARAIIALVLVAAFAFTFVLSSVGIVPIDALVLRAITSFSGSNENFPISINNDSVLYMKPIGDDILILTSDNVTVYSKNGREIILHPHSYAKPGVSVNGDKAIIYDRNGTGYMLISDSEVLYEGKADYTILSAQYGENGSYALSTKAKGATTALTVFNGNNKVVFQWNCAYEYITSIAISDNGRYVGVAAVGAENGSMLTTVNYFGIDYKEPLNTQKILNASPLALEFTGYNTLTLISETGIYVINRKADKYEKIYSYYSSEFNSCDISDKGKYIVTLAKYGSENVFETSVFTGKGNKKSTISTDFEIKTTCMSDKYIFILGEGCINVYNLSGKKVSEIKFKGDAKTLIPTDDFVFISSLDKLTRCYSFGNTTIELI